MVRILEAEAMGLCFGVRDALAVALERDDASEITIHGELVHNEQVLEQLRARGYRMAAEGGREKMPDTQKIMITAHGVSDRERRRLQAAGKQLVDTTCPLVGRVHALAQRLEAAGYFVVVIGRPGHVEVCGIVGDLSRFAVVDDADEVEDYAASRLGVVCQTTYRVDRAAEILGVIRQRNPNSKLRFVDTVCQPTQQRVRAVRELAARVDAVVVVGGANSNNTRQLARIASDTGVPTYHVNRPDDLDLAWFAKCNVVGLTAGTSSLDATIAAVRERLLRLNQGPSDIRGPGRLTA